MIPRPGIRILFATVEDLAGAIAEGLLNSSDSQAFLHLTKAAIKGESELLRLNDNIEALLANGIDVRTIPQLAVGDSRIKTTAHVTRARAFLALAIDSGALQLDEPYPGGRGSDPNGGQS